MSRCAGPFHLLICVAFVAGLWGGSGDVAAEGNPPALVSHRAVYELKLANTRGKLAAAQGLIVYDFSGTACEGYALQFRQVTELDNGEGRVVVSDLRSTTWEDGAGQKYRFNFQNFLNDNLVDSVDGLAERRADAVHVNLKKPAAKTLDITTVLKFPTEQMREIIKAARAGQTILQLAVFDGSENGEKLYNTLTVIGREISSTGRKPDDASADQAALQGMRRWPVSISYFDKPKGQGEQTPAYSINFELYENGISRALTLDYGDFSISGRMTTLEIRPTKPCL